jgi:DNA-binding NarL/FixJ family response regulator
MIKVIAFDDNAGIRDSLSLLLSETEEIHLIGCFANCNNVIRDISIELPHLVIMDIDMPGTNGIAAVRMIRKEFPQIQILMQTAFDDDQKIFAALQAGANGYILKNTSPGKLIEAMKEVIAGGSPMSPGVARKVILQFQTGSEEEQSEEANLSNREKEVLALLVKGKSYKMIADELSISYCQSSHEKDLRKIARNIND